MISIFRRLLLAGLVSSLVLFTSCNSGQSSNEVATIIGAGSSFVNPIMTRWIADFQQTNQNVHINYQSVGSGAGIEQLKKGLVDFGATDASLSDEKLKDMPPLIQLPESAGPVCITYNLPSLKDPLKLSGPTLAGIYLGTIKKWNDAAIAKDNAGVKLPGTSILVAHRSEGSGTSNLFTSYLDAVSPEWHSKVGKGMAVNWPTGFGGKGSEGVTGVVKQSEGGIGYVELTYASQNGLPVAQIRNKAGNWIAPSAESTSAAIAAFSKELAQDVRTLIVDPPATAADAYPISGLTFLLIPKEPKDRAKAQALQKFVQYITTSGQETATSLHYAKLPPELQQLDQQLLAQVTVPNQ
ncbi:MAG TPA: phosphate ABC transporter substrate-binding protein PstS [Terriglobales bacterium]|jgi:phosphate transport system substrate-binding protein|nr:phosphate ABC transporter substrate-binding protein PstS [Terriglobales bacterium]